ncbi:hypothetical protein [Gordonia sp. ABSL49_1]|uniref:hypothetical protein n=1 Tax=Gordonia sp. ABSL49_1 TaxID=2920941 RepID=UPI001F0DB633|nr:hypothetical protein [Gordonia sp. ABSL49_1]MCH5644251.1 hypothetical protein [Gordonia sp. ABSL49_1]
MTHAVRSSRDSDVLRRVNMVGAHGWDRSGFWAWSTGERLVVALVVGGIIHQLGGSGWGAVTDPEDQPSVILAGLGWTRTEAVQRWAGELFGGDISKTELWLATLANGIGEVAR